MLARKSHHILYQIPSFLKGTAFASTANVQPKRLAVILTGWATDNASLPILTAHAL